MASPLTVFLCSTYSDLIEEREGVLDAIRRLQLQHDSMEFFGARPGRPLETCLEEVRRSDVLIVVVGHRYGTVAPEIGISFSEAEYEEGFRLRKPCLVYMRADTVPVLPSNVEQDAEKIGLWRRWKQTLQTRHTVATFTDANDLAVQVAADLGRTAQSLAEGERTARAAFGAAEPALKEEINELLDGARARGVHEATLLSTVRRAVAALLAAEGRRETTVFLSYARADQEIVEAVAGGLRAAGMKVWFDQDDVKLGSNWIQEIERALDSADFFCFFLSPASMGSQWAQRELDVALYRQVSENQQTVLLPVLLADTEIPPLLRNIQYLDLRDGDVARAVGELTAAIGHHSKIQTKNPHRDEEA